MRCRAPPHPSKTLTRGRVGVPGQSPEEEAAKTTPRHHRTATWRYADSSSGNFAFSEYIFYAYSIVKFQALYIYLVIIMAKWRAITT